LSADGVIGKRLKEKRKELSLSLRELASRTGLTASFISQVERDLTSPSITSLRKIAQALGVPIFYFLMDHQVPSPVVRKNERRQLVIPHSHVRYELLAPDLNRKIEFLIARLAPGASSSDRPMTHPCEECHLVLQGRMLIQIGEERYVLEEGDSICYDGSVPHNITSIGDHELVFVSAITPPMF
jgi:transcriptional regulator with XRE-family HTH domain